MNFRWKKFPLVSLCCVLVTLLSWSLLRPMAVNAEEEKREDRTILALDEQGQLDVIRPDGTRAKFEWINDDPDEQAILARRLQEFVEGDVKIISHPETKADLVADLAGLFKNVTISADDAETGDAEVGDGEPIDELAIAIDDATANNTLFDEDNAGEELGAELFDEEDREGEEASAYAQRGVDQALRNFDATQSQRLEELRQRIEQKLTQQLQRRHQRQMEMIQRERQRLRRLEGQIRQQMERSQELIQLQTEAALDRLLSSGGLAEVDEPGDDFGHFGDEADLLRSRTLRAQRKLLSTQYGWISLGIENLKQLVEQAESKRDKELLQANLELQRQYQSAMQEKICAVQLAEVEARIDIATAEVKRIATQKELAPHEESDQHIPDRLVRLNMIRQHSSRLDELLLLIDDLRIQRWELHKQQDKLRQRDDDGKTQPPDDVPNDLDDLFSGR